MDNFEIKNADIESRLRDIGETLKKRVPEGMGFTVLMFDYGAGGAMFYLSSAQRADMINSMKEFIKKQEAKNG